MHRRVLRRLATTRVFLDCRTSDLPPSPALAFPLLEQLVQSPQIVWYVVWALLAGHGLALLET
jgi:hypothetical protein